MDSRIALCYGSILEYENLHITIGAEIGRGSNSLVYIGTYPDPITPGEKHIVLIKELFPLHQEGAIYRDENNCIVCKPEGEELFKVHKKSFLAGNEIHLRMLSECPGTVVSNIISFYKYNTAYTLLDYTGGRSLEKEMSIPGQPLRKLAERMIGLLHALEMFHSCGYLHLDIAADNTLLIGQEDGERVVLIDYNSAWRFNDPVMDVFPCSSIKYGYSSPEVRTGRLNLLCPASDLYSVTALFYRCISGNVPTPFQMMRPTPPDISQCPCITDQPPTVANQVCKILFKGLQAHPEHRYASCGELAEAFRELIDRIDGKGISHWALWEAGQKTVARMLKENAAMNYLKNIDALYPINAADGNDKIKPVGEWIKDAINKGDSHLIFTAPGGMGKTTAVLEYIIENGNKYSSASPAFIYIQLKRFCKGDKYFVTDSILENLRFKNDITTFETARHALKELLSCSIHCRNAVWPSAVVFLDGLNEIKDEHQELFDEIAQLSQLQGIKFIITSRTYESMDGFEELKITSLSTPDVQKQLSSNGLLMPQDKAITELLKTPLMLSIFIRTSKAEGKQLSIQSEEELIHQFFSSILEKELDTLSQDNNLRWQLEASVELVLPMLAAQTQEKGHALSDAELLEPVKKCYQTFSSPFFSRIFKQWIGHSKSILGEAKTEEEWYGIIVHSLLWQRLGLLVRDENGCYSMPHQILEDFLAQNGKTINQHIRNRKRVKAMIITAVFALFIVAGIFVYSTHFAPEPYNDDYMIPLLTDAVSEYIFEGQRYDSLCKLIESAGSTESFDAEYAAYKECQKQHTDILPMRDMLTERMKKAGEVCSWSHKPFDFSRYSQMREVFAQRDADYEWLTGLLENIMHNKHLYDSYYKAFMEQLKNIIEIDADISSAFFIKVCKPHLTDSFIMETEEGYQLDKSLLRIPEQRKHEENNSRDISAMLGERNAAMESSAIGIISKRNEITEIFGE